MPALDPAVLVRHRRRNALQSALILAAIAGWMAVVGWLVAGGEGIVWAMAGTGLLLLVQPAGSAALENIERIQGGGWERLWRAPVWLALIRTHPTTAERQARLAELAPRTSWHEWPRVDPAGLRAVVPPRRGWPAW